MIDALIRWSLNHRATVAALAAAFLVWGGWTTARIPLDVLPDLTAPSVTILTEAPGMDPLEIESLVTFPIESALNGAAGVRRVRSATAVGVAVVWVEFDWGQDIARARQTVTEKLALVSGTLPPSVEPPFLAPVSSIMGEVLFIDLESDRHSPREIRTVADTLVRRRLLAKPIIDNLDFIMRRMHGGARFTNQVADHQGERRDPAHPTAESLLESKTLEIAPINYLRGRSIHDTAIIVDDGQNLTQEDMKLVLTRAGEGSRVILTGDPDQIDREEINSLSRGLVQVVERFKGEPCFAHLTMHEVMRSQVAEMAAKLL